MRSGRRTSHPAAKPYKMRRKGLAKFLSSLLGTSASLVVTSASLVVTGALLVGTRFARISLEFN